jgi:hypothetical protein
MMENFKLKVFRMVAGTFNLGRAVDELPLAEMLEGDS